MIFVAVVFVVVEFIFSVLVLVFVVDGDGGAVLLRRKIPKRTISGLLYRSWKQVHAFGGPSMSFLDGNL